MERLLVPAVKEQHEAVTEFVERVLICENCPDKARMKMLIALDEIFSNIVNYSGASQITVECGRSDNRILLCIQDDGAAFDPFSQSEPDITLDADQRKIGGLGIYLVKKSMTDATYEYRDGKNVITLEEEMEL